MGRQDCPACGKPLVVPEQAHAQPISGPPGPGSDSSPPGEGIPWEHRDDLGVVTAWARTVQMVLFEPSRAYRSVRVGNDVDHFWFALVTGSVSWALSQLIHWLLAGPTNAMMQRLAERMGAAGNPMLAKVFEQQRQFNSRGWTIALLLFTPLIVAILLYLNAGVTHLFAMLFRQAKRGFPATFAACAYAHAPLILVAIPGCGSFIALIWMMVLIGIGLKETHQIGAGGATATVLAPYLIFCCACGGLFVLTVMAGMQAGLAGAR